MYIHTPSKDECKQWPELAFFLLCVIPLGKHVYLHSSFLSLSFFPRLFSPEGDTQKYGMKKLCCGCCCRRQTHFRLTENFFLFSSLLFFFFFTHSLTLSFFLCSMFCFFAFSSLYSFLPFISVAREWMSRIFFLMKKRIKDSAGCLFFSLSFIHSSYRVKLEHNINWHKSWSTNEKTMFVHNIVCIGDDN